MSRSAKRYRKITLDVIGKLRRLILIVLPDQIFTSFCDLAEIEEVLDLLLALFYMYILFRLFFFSQIKL